MLAVTGDGFSYAELENYAKDIRKELIIVPGVAAQEQHLAAVRGKHITKGADKRTVHF